MTNLEYLKLQADNLFSDFQTKTIDDEGLFQFTAQYFDADWIVLDFDLDEENLTLDDARSVVASLSGFGFDGWQELLKAEKEVLNTARLIFDNHDKISDEVWSDHLGRIEEMNPGIRMEEIDLIQLLQKVISDDMYNLPDYRIKKNTSEIKSEKTTANKIEDNIIEFFRLQAKNIHRDYKTRREDINEYGAVCYKYKPEYFDIKRIFTDYHVDESNFTLMKAQHVIARMVGFKKWDDLIKGSLDALEIGHILFTNQDTISMRGYLAEIAQDDKNPMGLHYAGLLHSLAYYEEGENAEEDYRLRRPEPKTQTFFGCSRR